MIQKWVQNRCVAIARTAMRLSGYCTLLILMSFGFSKAATTITIEAENANVTSPMAILSDANALGGLYVAVPQPAGDNLTDATFGGPGEASFDLNIAEAGRYTLWARTLTPSGKGERGSFYVTRDGSKLREWMVPKSTVWKWNKVALLKLTPGPLNLSFRQRTDGTQLDQIVLSNEKRFVPGKTNRAPNVDAGLDQSITLPNSANLNATITDDGLPNPPASLTSAWSKVSGPGTVTFGNAAAVDTTASFSQNGSYVLRLTVNDGALQASDDVTVHVQQSDFALIVLPDTQFYSQDQTAIFAEQTQWIVDNRSARNISYVVHLGDIVENANISAEWEHASSAMSILENPSTTGLPDGIPYGVAVGNHDQDPQGNPAGNSTSLYNTYFGENRFAGKNYYGGHFGTNNDSHYSFFSAGGMDFIVVFIEFDPNAGDSVLVWADNLLKAHIDRRAIVVSHYLVEPGNPAPFGIQGEAIYESLKGNANLFLMLAGHRTEEGQRTDVFNGNTVHTLLSDFQDRANGGNGWLRILEFSPANNQIRVRTYSPTLNQFETDTNSQFILAYDTTPNPNLPPVTRVGPDQAVTMPDAITVDGTVSDDGMPNPLVVTWSKVSGPGTVTFANPHAVDTTATFSAAGPYMLRLTATDGQKASSAEMIVLVSPETPNLVTLDVEAESGILSAPMAVQSSVAASGGQFVVVPEGSGNSFDSGTRGGPGQLALPPFNILQGGAYALWARTLAPSFGSNSFFVTNDSNLIDTWDVPVSAAWQWNKVGEIFLGAGTFNLQFRQREDGTQLDRVILTNDLNFTPN